MKVPIYKSQTVRSAEGGARFLNVSANPSQLSLGARALAATGQQVANEAQTFYRQLVTERRNSDLRNAQTEFGAQVSELQLASLNQNPTTVMGNGPRGFKKQAQEKAIKLADALSSSDKLDSVTRKRFLARSTQIINDASASVNKTARSRQIDAIAASYIERADALVLQAQMADGSKKQRILDELFGNTKRKIVGIYQQMANAGAASPTDVLRYEKTQKELLSRIEIEAELNAADYRGSRADLLQIVLKLKDPRLFPDLSPLQRLGYQRQAINLEQALENKDLREAERTSAAAGRQKKAHQTETFAQYRVQLSNALNQIPDPEGNTVNLPTLGEIGQSLTNGDITAENFNFLYNVLTNNDATSDNPGSVIEYTNMIIEAERDEELDNIREQITSDTGLNKNLTLNTAESLLKFINQEQADTQDKAEYKLYFDRLNELTRGGTAEASISSLLGLAVDKDPNALPRREEALLDYFYLTQDRTNPKTPKKAFEKIKREFELGLSSKFPFLVGPDIMTLLGFGFSAKDGLDIVKQLTEDEINQAERNFEINQTFTTAERIEIFEKLQIIKKLVLKDIPGRSTKEQAFARGK